MLSLSSSQKPIFQCYVYLPRQQCTLFNRFSAVSWYLLQNYSTGANFQTTLSCCFRTHTEAHFLDRFSFYLDFSLIWTGSLLNRISQKFQSFIINILFLTMLLYVQSSSVVNYRFLHCPTVIIKLDPHYCTEDKHEVNIPGITVTTQCSEYVTCLKP
jgi:hypothetical protein